MPLQIFLRAIKPVYRLPPVLVLSILFTCAPSLVRESMGYATLTGFLSDLFCALLLSSLLLWLPRFGRSVLLLVWSLSLLGSFMLLESMSRLPSWHDLHFLLQGDFLANSLAESASIPLLPMLWVGSTLVLVLVYLVFLPAQPVALSRRGRVILLATLVLSLTGHKVVTRFAADDENLYAQFNPWHWMAADLWSVLVQREAESAAYLLVSDLGGKPLLPAKGQAKNVLIVVMEGMTGLYLESARKRIMPEQASNPVMMPRLSEWSARGRVTPDFIVHNHQTIRGLYALLCSDMDKLANTTPKAFELQNAQSMADQCLPAQLGRAGFSTHFLQGAGLAFMGKDKVMPAIGFQQVHGSEWFARKSGQNFGWGVDDKVFFQGALKYIDGLREAGKQPDSAPWMLTLLTVGTHQPYAVPKSYTRRFSDRRDAATAYLDDSVGDFLKGLEKRGVLKDTLVVLTSDESQGVDLADWISAWGINILMAPDIPPGIQDGQFALIDTSLTVLDYFRIPTSRSTWGRSLLRQYSKPREMVSNTAGRLRWLMNDGHRYECTSLGSCRACKARTLLGSAECSDGVTEPYAHLASKVAWLDETVTRASGNAEAQTLRFANGEHLKVAKPWKNEWSDNLVGAQYLNFPAGTRTEVTMRWRVTKAGKQGARLQLFLKQYEQAVQDVITEVPVIQQGEETEYKFTIDNPEARKNFSFHLVGAVPMEIDLLDFTVVTYRAGGETAPLAQQ